MKVPVFLALFGCAFSASSLALDWPEFRGPTGQGQAPGAEVPTNWSASQNIRWKVPIAGSAWSSPIVVGETIYATTAVVDGESLSLRTIASNLGDGASMWETEIFVTESSRIHKKNSHASPTPLYKDGRVFVHFGDKGTAALDASTGAILWKKSDYPYEPVHGSGGSPVVFENLLIYSVDGKDDPVVLARDIDSGEIRWETPRDVEVSRPFSFSTPLLIEVGGKTQAVVPGSGAVISYDPSTGAEIWRCRYGEGFSVVPRPLFHEGVVYVCSGFMRATLYAIRADGRGDVTDTHILWEESKAIPKESSPIIVGDLLFINDDKGIISCFDAATGEEHYRERADGEGGYSASPVYAGGHLYFHNGGGVTTVVKPGKRFEVVAENRLDEFGLSSFAVVADGFVIRTEDHLFRIGE